MNLVVKNLEKLEELPNKEKPTHTYSDKYYNRNYFPYRRVYRFLRSRVGKLEADIVSEFLKCKWIPATERTYTKFRELVETNTFIKNKEIYYYDEYAFNGSFERRVKDHRNHYYYSCSLFYINPIDKTLQIVPTYPVEPFKKNDNTIKILGDYHQFLKLNGVWYEIKAELTKWRDTETKLLNSNFFVKFFRPHDALINVPWVSNIKIVYKKQLNHSELIKNNLKNDLNSIPKDKCPICGGFGCRTIHK